MSEKRQCRKCKKDMTSECVCDYFVTHICEDGYEYECSCCWTSNENENYMMEKHTRKILQDILEKRNRNE